MRLFPTKFSIPDEMKSYANFVCWGLGGDTKNKDPYSPITGTLSKCNDANTWASYQQACEYAEKYGFAGIGFVLSQYDPFALIDLDCPQGDAQLVATQEAIFKNIYSYAEMSPSAQGLHIVVKGRIPKGRRRNKIEIYSSGRYMTMTGNVYRNAPINNCQEELTNLYQSLGGNIREAQIMDGQMEEVEDDDAIYEKAANAANGEKFVDLWEGRWQEYYPNSEGPSEADFALIDIIAYYTDSKSQIVRMFHKSALGQCTRKNNKVKRQDYLNWMLDRCFDNKLPPLDLSFFQSQIAEEIARVNLEIENPGAEEKKNKLENNVKEKTNVYQFPPGLIGEIAQFVYAKAPRPVQEIALAAALGLMSGIAGKAYNVSGTGLNMYYLMLAGTGRGKDGMTIGINSLLNEVKKLTPRADDFLGPGEISSAQALIKHMSDGNTSLVSVIGEFAIKLKQMVAANAPTHLLGLRRILLDLYGRSGQGQSVRPSIYADKAKNTKAIISPAISILAESTPQKFYEVLDDSMISEGWLPRWLVIEYKGPRVPKNYDHTSQTPSYSLVEKVATLCSNCTTLNSQNSVVDIQFTEEGNRVQNEYDKFCDNQINTSKHPIRVELWNRAHLKVLKLAGLVAVGINPIEPVICEHCVNWAIGIVNKDCVNILQRFDAGEIGSDADENLQIMKILEVITIFLKKPFKEFTKSVRELPKFGLYHSEKIIPYNYIQRACVGTKIFKQDRLGATNAIKKTIKTLIETDEIGLVSSSDRKSKFDSISPCYIVKNKAILQDAYRKGIL